MLSHAEDQCRVIFSVGAVPCVRVPVGERRDHKAHGVAQILESIFYDGGDDFALHAAGLACTLRVRSVCMFATDTYVGVVKKPAQTQTCNR